MNRHSIAALVAAGTFVLASTAAVAVEQGAASAPGTGMADMSKPHAMMKEGTKDSEGGMGSGMMGMMRSCQAMMGDAKTSGSAMMPALPPGNEKLAFQMQAEMMQKMGEIAVKYADRIKEAK